MSLLETGDPVKTAHYGAVAASFVVQQLGLPKLEVQDCGAYEICEERVGGCVCDRDSQDRGRRRAVVERRVRARAACEADGRCSAVRGRAIYRQ